MKSNNNSSVLSMSEKYDGVYLVFDNIVIKDGREHIEVQCPCCLQNRFIRATLLSNNNKQKPKSTICHDCSAKTEILFYKEKESDDYSFTIVNGEKVFIDDDDINKIKNVKLQLSIDKKYVEMRLPKNKLISLHRWLMCADENNAKVIDHINHNTFDNRKCNLRYANTSDNMLNTKISICNNTGFKNISICKNRKAKWFCQFIENKKRITKRFKKFLDAYNYMYENHYSKKQFVYSVLQDATLNLRYSGIEFDDVSNGDGLGAVFFTQYCPHHCKQCHNPQTWSKYGGKEFNIDVFNNLMRYYESVPFANRLTISGGDPLASLEVTNFIASEFKRRYPNKQLWIYTGYLFEDLIKDSKYLPILELTDVIIDGKFDINKRDVTLKFRGSANQRIIDVSKSLKQGEIVLYNN